MYTSGDIKKLNHTLFNNKKATLNEKGLFDDMETKVPQKQMITE